jgi:hypothetical protein
VVVLGSTHGAFTCECSLCLSDVRGYGGRPPGQMCSVLPQGVILASLAVCL